MKTFLILLVLFTVLLGAASAQNAYTMSSDFVIGIYGSSNVHDWNETVNKVSGNASVLWNNDGSFNLQSLTVKVDINSIISDHGSTMNNKTFKALKSDSYPQIVFTLSDPLKNIKSADNGNSVMANGSITIAGVTKPVTMLVKIYIGEHGKIVFEGQQALKMSDYGIEPPTALAGMMKVADGVVVKFKTTFLMNAQL